MLGAARKNSPIFPPIRSIQPRFNVNNRSRRCPIPADSQARRRFLKLAVAGAVVGADRFRRCCRASRAPTTCRIWPRGDPTAKALGYKEDATKVDTAKFATYKAGLDVRELQVLDGQGRRRVRPVRALPRQGDRRQGLVLGVQSEGLSERRMFFPRRRAVRTARRLRLGAGRAAVAASRHLRWRAVRMASSKP